MADLATVMTIAAAAAVASPLGGLVALWRKPTTLFMSIALGFASGVLIGTICFSMLPEALALTSVWRAAGGFALGFAAIFTFDLFIHRWKLAGKNAEQRPQVEHFYQRRRPRGTQVSVLAGGTSIEELIEGLSIGEIIRTEPQNQARNQTRRILGWTGLIGVALAVSTLVGWFFLRGLSPSILGFLFGVGGGGMFYLVVTDLVPEAEERQYQQSAALSIGLGFLLMFVLSRFLHGG